MSYEQATTAEALLMLQASLRVLEHHGPLPPEVRALRDEIDGLLREMERQEGVSQRAATLVASLRALATAAPSLAEVPTDEWRRLWRHWEPPPDPADSIVDAGSRSIAAVSPPAAPAHGLAPRRASVPSRSVTPVGDSLEIPVNPPVHAALGGIYAGGEKPLWDEDEHGRPQYVHQTSRGHVTIKFHGPPAGLETAAAVWEWVARLQTETADIFLVLISRLAELPDPRQNTARLRLDEIADERGVHLRGGRVSHLYDDFVRQIQALAEMRLTMVWDDPRGRGKLTFGQPVPDRVLDIVGVELEQDGSTWQAFSFRAGQAMAHFMNVDEIRWLGRYARALLRLNPHTESRVKRLGTYWTLIGTIAGKHARSPRVTPRSMLAFMGEAPNVRFPGRTVDGLTAAHQRLHEIGILATLPELEPAARTPGFFQAWLDTPVSARLLPAPEGPPDLAMRRLALPPAALAPPMVPASLIPAVPDAATLQAMPALIREFRTVCRLTLQALGRELGVSHSTLSRYERGLCDLPAPTAVAIVAIWQRRRAG